MLVAMVAIIDCGGGTVIDHGGGCYNFTVLPPLFLLTLFSFYKLCSRTLCTQRTYSLHVFPVHMPVTCPWFAYSYVPFPFHMFLLLY